MILGLKVKRSDLSVRYLPGERMVFDIPSVWHDICPLGTNSSSVHNSSPLHTGLQEE